MEKRVNKVTFILLSFFLGSLGVDRFMRGQIGLGVLKIVTFGGMGIWSLADFVIALIKMGDYQDEFVFKDGKWA